MTLWILLLLLLSRFYISGSPSANKGWKWENLERTESKAQVCSHGTPPPVLRHPQCKLSKLPQKASNVHQTKKLGRLLNAKFCGWIGNKATLKLGEWRSKRDISLLSGRWLSSSLLFRPLLLEKMGVLATSSILDNVIKSQSEELLPSKALQMKWFCSLAF